jgi:hypothetical protein
MTDQMPSSAAVPPPPRQKLAGGLVRQATRGGTRLRRGRKRWLIPVIVVATVSVALAIGLLVVYPRVGASALRDKLTSKLGGKLGRDVKLGAVDVSLGHATVRDIEIRGPNDGELPLVYIARVEVDFEALPSLIGRVRLGAAQIEGLVMTVRRHADGRDNVKDVIERLQAQRGGGGKTDGDEPGSMPTSITVTKVKLVADDAKGGATVVVNDGGATWKPGELLAQLREVTATTTGAPKASAAKLDIKKLSGSPPTLAVSGGEIALWPRLALSSIGGTISADLSRPGQFNIDLVGGYGGVPNLWTAKGPLDTRTYTASIELEAQKFQLDRLAPILARSPVVDYQNTSVDTKIKLDVSATGGKFDGQFSLRGLNVGHPLLAEKDVHDLDLTGKISGSFDRATRRFELSRGDFKTRDVAFSVTGSAARGQAAPLEAADVKRGPGGIQLLEMRLVIPPVDCQRVLDAIPKEMAPYMAGYKVRGVFDTDVRLAIDWDRLDDVELGGHVGYKHCKIVGEPADSAKRLLKEFEHYVEIEKGKWHSFVVGPANEDFVPFEDISQHLVKSIMSTEDSAFYHHKGFITSEFRTALVNDLKMGAFRYGASSITMQMVKNVLLYRDKTLARKLQELFLTWHVESTLTKDRILEIYFNVIEYGPGLYGIGPAVKHFFGKSPKELNPVEAAFFSTILPSPKERYKQYCAGTLTKWTKDKIERILGIMLKRDRLTQTEYDQAMATPLVFVKDGNESEQECLKRTNNIIKKARSTNPLKR